MTFLDTGILAGALLEKHPEHQQCLAAFEQFDDCFTDAHTLAETFATLTGFYKVPAGIAAELTLGLKENIIVEPLPLADYETAIRQARSRGVMGGEHIRFIARHFRPPQTCESDRHPQPFPLRPRRTGFGNLDTLQESNSQRRI